MQQPIPATALPLLTYRSMLRLLMALARFMTKEEALALLTQQRSQELRSAVHLLHAAGHGQFHPQSLRTVLGRQSQQPQLRFEVIMSVLEGRDFLLQHRAARSHFRLRKTYLLTLHLRTAVFGACHGPMGIMFLALLIPARVRYM